MIQLTARLNERDQSILALQDELDGYDSQQRMEEALDQKTNSLIKLQKLAIQQDVDPSKIAQAINQTLQGAVGPPAKLEVEDINLDGPQEVRQDLYSTNSLHPVDASHATPDDKPAPGGPPAAAPAANGAEAPPTNGAA